MASAGLLLLLLVSSSLILSSLSAPSSSNQQGNVALQKRTDAKKVVLTAVQYTERFLTALAPFLGLIPVHGPLISAMVNLAGVGLSIPGLLVKDPSVAIKAAFENLNMKIDRYYEEQTWDTWASAYHNHENNIKVAWNDFEALLNDLQSKTPRDVKSRNSKLFNEMYKNFVSATKMLHSLLTASGETFMTDFGKLVADHFRCHEAEIKKFTKFINTLIYKGNTMSLYYYRSHELDKTDELAKIAFDSGSVMFEIQKHCLSYPDNYIKLDVQELIDVNKEHEVLAMDIRSFLERTHVRYDWVVLAFRATNVQHRYFPIGTKHTLSGFIEVTRGEITVAVARQGKGTFTQAKKISDAIQLCFKDDVKCEDVPKTLEKCEGIPQKMIVHAYTNEGHYIDSSTNAKEYKGEDGDDISLYENVVPPTMIPYYYKGRCIKHKAAMMRGTFIILIQSDQEMDTTKLCQNKKCGGKDRGECVVLENTVIAVCECKNPFYGEECEDSLDDYKKKMNEEMPKN